jgi:NAD+ synthase
MMKREYQNKNNIVKWIKFHVNKAGAKGLVLGLSGGIDSAVVAALCKLAFPDNTLGIVMPCDSQSEDEYFAKKVASSLNLKTEILILDKVYNTFKKILPQNKSLKHSGNIKPRLRMASLYYYAGINNYLVAGTGNKTEISLGYFTKWGDGACDILPIGDLYKSEVKILAAELNIPQDIIDRKPSAGLWKGQTDEKEIGISYDDMDSILGSITDINKLNKIESVKIDKLKQMINNSEHKRNQIPIYNKRRSCD